MGLLDRAAALKHRPEHSGSGLLARARQLRDTGARMKNDAGPVLEKKNGFRNPDRESPAARDSDLSELLPVAEAD